MNQEQGRHYEVLVIGESRNTVDEVTEWVAQETEKYDSVISSDRTVRLKKNARYQLIVLCFEELADSREMCERLVEEFDSRGQEVPAIIVLCSKDEMKEAFALCDAGTFDNYVIFRPLYDPYRLQLVLRHNLRYQRARGRGDAVLQEMENVGRVEAGLEKLSREFAEQSKDVRARTRDRLKGMHTQLKSGIQKVSKTLEAESSGEEDARIRSRVEEELKRFAEEMLQREIQGASAEMDDWMVEWTEDVSSRQSELQGTLKDVQARSRKLGSTVLVVDDEAMTRELLCHFFEDEEYKTIASATGHNAISRAFNDRPDVILLDLHLPDLEGDEVIRRLRENPATRTIPVIMLTGEAKKDTVLRIVSLGVAGYQVKPPDRARLLEQVAKALTSKH